MANIIYAKNTGLNDAMIGKIDTPVKMFIEKEASKYEKKSSFLNKVFNVEKSNTFGETILAQSSFGMFQAAKEGQGGENDSIAQTYKKFIEHVPFMKEFTVSQEMVEDAKMGIAAELSRRASAFVEAYYHTQEQAAVRALSNGTATSMSFNGATVDISTYDDLPLFHSAHKFFTPEMAKKTQSNRYWGNITESAGALEEGLSEIAVKLENVLDENGEPLGYLADTILIPSDNAKLRTKFKKVVGSERTTSSDFNDININYGNWNLVVVPGWRTGGKDDFMVMSSQANKSLAGNMFFNRVPLTINSWQDNHTWNYICSGRCRFGVGFGSYKHIMLVHGTSNKVDGATAL